MFGLIRIKKIAVLNPLALADSEGPRASRGPGKALPHNWAFTTRIAHQKGTLMTDRHKRSLLKLAVLAAAASAIVACGKKDEPAPTAAAPTPAPATEAAAPAPAKADPLKIGFVYVGPIGDGG